MRGAAGDRLFGHKSNLHHGKRDAQSIPISTYYAILKVANQRIIVSMENQPFAVKTKTRISTKTKVVVALALITGAVIAYAVAVEIKARRPGDWSISS